MKGRKPTPTSLRLLRGNPGKRPYPEAEARPEPKLSRPPEHLSAKARREWWRTGKRLLALGLVAEIDEPALAAYCQAYGRWAEAEEKLREFGPVVKTPQGHITQSPYLSIANRALEQIMKILPEFGMTPSSRSRVTALPEADEDPLEELRRGAR